MKQAQLKTALMYVGTATILLTSSLAHALVFQTGGIYHGRLSTNETCSVAFMPAEEFTQIATRVGSNEVKKEVLPDAGMSNRQISEIAAALQQGEKYFAMTLRPSALSPFKTRVNMIYNNDHSLTQIAIDGFNCMNMQFVDGRTEMSEN